MSRRRFNLIELVIVVTVLLSIGSLFLPTIIKVTAHGQIAACQDNLRQLHKGFKTCIREPTRACPRGKMAGSMRLRPWMA